MCWIFESVLDSHWLAVLPPFWLLPNSWMKVCWLLFIISGSLTSEAVGNMSPLKMKCFTDSAPILRKIQSSPSHIWTWKHHTTNFESCTWLYLLQDYAKFGAHGGPTSCSIWETTRLLVTFWCMCVRVWWLGGVTRTNINLKDPERSYLKYTPDPCVLFSLLPVKPWAWRSITVGEYPPIFQHYPVPVGRLQTSTLAY